MKRTIQSLSLELPEGYYLERDPDVLVLRRLDGTMVGAFSARGVATEAVLRAIEESARGEPSTGDEAVPPALRARFFGHFELLCNEEVIHLRTKGKALAILKQLLAHRSRPVSQDHLMGWLWPDSNLKKARWSLNSAIHGLRKLLGSCSSSASVTYVLLEEGYYRLNPETQVATDVEEFDERYERGRHLERAGQAEEAARAYEKAVALYRGDYLLEDLYEDWTMVERERLSNAYGYMLDRLAVHYLQSGQPRESVRYCYRALEKDRCHEDSHRLLMRCYVQLGQRGRALRQYRLCERILDQKYGTAPSPETRSLRRRIASGEAAG